MNCSDECSYNVKVINHRLLLYNDPKSKIVIRLGCLYDVNSLVELNQLWFKLNVKNIENGFLSIAYDDSFFINIINNNDLIVFTNKNKIEGYVLINTVIRTSHVDNLKTEYFINRIESQSKKIAFSYQILINKSFQGTGFFYKAQKEYFKHFKKKYDLLVSTVSKENIRSIKAHKKAGWTFIDTSKNYFIIQYFL